MTWPKRVRREVEERSGRVCEGCGQRHGENLHHRKYKSRGGADTLANALLLCGFGNASGCHGRAHSGDGADLGWSVSRFAPNPAAVPAYRHGVGWVLYLDEPNEHGDWWTKTTDPND